MLFSYLVSVLCGENKNRIWFDFLVFPQSTELEMLLVRNDQPTFFFDATNFFFFVYHIFLTPQIFPAIFWHPFAHTSAASIITSNQEKWSLSLFLSLSLSLSLQQQHSFSFQLSKFYLVLFLILKYLSIPLNYIPN
jgi:hypothetical protein